MSFLRPLRRVCLHINSEVESAFPGNAGQGWHFVRLCLFYRFIFPSIIDSSQYEVFSQEVKGYGLRYSSSHFTYFLALMVPLNISNYLVAVTKLLHSVCQELEVEQDDSASQGEKESSNCMNKFIQHLLVLSYC